MSNQQSIENTFNKSFDSISKKIDNLSNYTSPIVYRGTLSDFKKIDKSKIISSYRTQFSKIGSFFASNPIVAISYASKQLKHQKNIETMIEKLMNEKFDIIKLKFFQGNYINSTDEKIVKLNNLINELYSLIDEEPILDKHGKFKKYILHFKKPYVFDNKGDTEEGFNEKGFMEKLVSLIKSQNYDGLIIKNVYDAITSTALFELTDIYVAFDESQIEEI